MGASSPSQVSKRGQPGHGQDWEMKGKDVVLREGPPEPLQVVVGNSRMLDPCSAWTGLKSWF
jgi:hypothetical protein